MPSFKFHLIQVPSHPTTMKNKLRVFLSLQHRSALSIRENRQATRPRSLSLGDGILLDETTGMNLNTDGNWNFREKTYTDPQAIAHFLGSVMIGKLPKEITNADIRDILKDIALPQPGAKPEQNCVSWTRNAIMELQEKGLVEQCDLDRFMDDALACADKRLRDYSSTPASINYTDRPM
ncbi:hypothetical protein N7481_012814 [Penicillium waksmanii]|uniref:uncharacterized protein n=1 Tax=Penicillium waksmanii TaxID=69791 RepID=UPI002549051B|nr:uncharacterized protein N7481_012814 [Penicillium waksmanii]KAJ5966100.1 hypothetical protein N7481_012814 [Penicillium waksmanii]